jgi:signal transduction histidine kinase/DNA-binding response OmpR family regulator/ABC-type amino acid transport substrate-binding protein
MALVAIFLIGIFSNCDKSAKEQSVMSQYHSFRDIPGVTDEEIKAIETLRKQGVSFVYGALETTEAFPDQNGKVEGFTVLFCEWLSELFGIPFTPELYLWDDLVAGLQTYKIDFTGELTPTEERRKTWFMTDAIAERSVKHFRIAGSKPIAEIEQLRPVRYVFLEGTITVDAVTAMLVPGTYEITLVANNNLAYDLIKSGKADTYINEGPAEASLDVFGDVLASDFFPLVYEQVSLSTRNPSLEPVISVIQKMLQSGGISYLTELYNTGYYEYLKSKLFAQLSEVERSYIQNHSVIPYAAETSNYPVSFYNTREKQWQGIALEVLHEVELLSTLRFKRINDENADWPDLFKMLEDGKVSMITELIFSDVRASRFLWAEAAFMVDNPTLISKYDYYNVHLNEIMYVKVGLIRNSGITDLFRRWFPNHSNAVEYENTMDALDALDMGQVDMVMTSSHELLIMTHYLERTGYKANFVFDYPFKSTFGFHKDEAVLRSIVDKAMRLINTDLISNYWMRKTYDYRLKVVQAQIPWFIGAGTLLSFVLVLLFILFLRNQQEGRRLENLVEKRASQLKKQNDLMEAVTKNYKGVIWSVDRSGIITTFRGQYLRTLGLRPVYLEGKNIDIIRQKNRYMDIIEYVDKTFRDGAQDWISDSDGAVFHSYTTPIYDDEKRIISVVGSTDEVTEMVKLQRDLEAAVKTAEAASQAKSRFLATMSHEIRTPLNAILGIAEIQLQNEKLFPDTEEALRNIYNSGDLLLSIINDILDLSKIEAGKLELVPANYEVASLINNTANINTMRIGGKHIKLKLSIDEKMPAVLLGDELRILQIFNNLLSNAIKYTDQGVVELSVSAEKGNTEKDAMLVCGVSDTGRGMSEEQLNKLFSEYVRFNTEANRMTEGTGLGLSITNNLVKLMGGEISVDSKMGKGSVFTVRLPQGKADFGILGKEMAEKLEKFQLNESKLARKAQIIFEPMPHGSVLIVDDVVSNLYVAKGLMKPYEMEIDTVNSGFEAIDKIEDGGVYDIVFMDHMMPGMDGIEATQKIRGLGYTQPIIALTANAVVGQSDIFMKNGFDGFISKPIDMRQLDAILKKFVRDKAPKINESDSRKKDIQKGDLMGEIGQVPPELVKIVLQDVARSVAVLEELKKKGGVYTDDDIQEYTVNTHALKSALGNIGETEISAAAYKLEQAGRAKDAAAMKNETPVFLNKLGAVIEKWTRSV